MYILFLWVSHFLLSLLSNFVFPCPPTFSIEKNDLGVVNLGTNGRITFDTRIIGELDTLAYRWPILESFAGVSVLLLAPSTLPHRRQRIGD